jgi:hypothetical protein
MCEDGALSFLVGKGLVTTLAHYDAIELPPRTANSPRRGMAPTLAVTAPVITFCHAVWNCSISAAVPIVMRA